LAATSLSGKEKISEKGACVPQPPNGDVDDPNPFPLAYVSDVIAAEVTLSFFALGRDRAAWPPTVL
jgi:hypothetical protein